MRPWSALVVPPSLDGRTRARFAALNVGPQHLGTWGSGPDAIPGVFVTPDPFGTPAIERMLDLLVTLNLDYLREHPGPHIHDAGYRPPLYHSGASYRHEVPDRPEQWLCVPWIADSAWDPNVLADCKGLSAWRVAELRMAGESRAKCVWSLQEVADRVVVHIRVQRADGSREDPSALLGMGRPIRRLSPWL